MIVHVRPGAGAVIGAHVKSGDKARRLVFITPAGCSFDAPPNLAKADLSVSSYDVDAGECGDALKAAIEAGHEGLKTRIELREGSAPAPAAARQLSRK